MAEPEPILARRPAQATDVWERQGKLLHLSRDAFDKSADGWLWPGPVDEHERSTFWSVVQAARCVLFEHMNDAVLGLVWLDGNPVVAYDVPTIRSILKTKRAVSSSSDEEHADARDEAQLAALQEQGWGVRTPVFRTV